MTKEAKVGLLLGLLFIIGIAVVLRGMSRNSRATLEKELLANEMSVKEAGDSLSEAVNLSAVNHLSSTEPTATETASAETPAASAAESNPSATASMPVSTQADAGAIRHVQDLPGAVESRSIVPPSGVIDRALDKVTVQARAEGAVGAASQLANAGPSKVYEVKSGDDLTRVAVNVYGQQRGKQWSNIKRIYEANRTVLPTMDALKVGQKLTIPPLPAESAPVTAVLASTSSSSSSKPAAAPAASVSRPAEKTVDYVVKEGDSLWKIAKDKLGSGTRCKDIQKLNGLHDDSSLKNGMHLKLPSK